MTATIVIGILAGLLLAATLASFLRIPHGFVRSFSFPRLQILVVAAVLVAASLWWMPPSTARWSILAALLAVLVVQALCILPFTPLWKKQSKGRVLDDPKGKDGPDTVSVLSYNVKMSNRDYASTLAIAHEADADLLLFMETDQAWCDALDVFRKTHPHVLSAPYDNAYGMILFSRLTLSDTTIRCLLMEEVPSFGATVTLRDGQRFRFHAVHPEPPVPTMDSLGRDAELLMVADIVKTERLPSVVSGDLNDVAWSNTTRLFQRVSRLLDPRIGRGFYNTFDARFPFLRWPLDHLFHDARFAIVAIERLPAGGSDHFPMFFRLALTPSAAGADMPEPEDEGDRAEKREIIADGKKLDREAIGVDWES
jgi:endonuclease/exonuclease/phosphatase (EEP) superfamily protein YafD